MTATAFDNALAAARRLPISFSNVDDAALVAAAHSAGQLQQVANAVFAAVAGEVARRSDRSLGSAGLAQRAGHRTPQELLRVTTGSTARDAFTAVRVGLMPDTHPWVPALPDPAAADAIATGLGLPSEGVSEEQLAAAATALSSQALER